MRPSPPTSRSSTTRGEPRRPPRRRWPPRGPPRRLPSGTPRGPGWGTGAGVSGATDLVAPVALEGTPARPWPEAPWQPRRPPPASSASPAPDGLPAMKCHRSSEKGAAWRTQPGRERRCSERRGPTWVRHPAGAALESAPERAVAARRFRFRVAARPAAVARRPMGAAPSAPGPHQAGRRLLAAARYASPASSERWWGRHVVASCRPSCAAAASLTGSKLVDGESAARPAVARSGRRLPGRTVEDSGEQPNPAAVSPEASHLGSATTAT